MTNEKTSCDILKEFLHRHGISFGFEPYGENMFMFKMYLNRTNEECWFSNSNNREKYSNLNNFIIEVSNKKLNEITACDMILSHVGNSKYDEIVKFESEKNTCSQKQRIVVVPFPTFSNISELQIKIDLIGD